MSEKSERLPDVQTTLPVVHVEHELEPFTPVKETTDDRETTESDLALLNNHLAMCNAVLPHAKTFQSLCMLSATVCKLLETRRKVKKLQYGAKDFAGRNPFEVLPD